MGGSFSQQKKSSGQADTTSTNSSTSDSEGHFETPEAATPVHVPLTVPGELENNTDAGSADLEQEEQLIVTGPASAQELLLDHNMGQDEPVVPLGSPCEINKTQTAENTEDLPAFLPSEPVSDLPLTNVGPDMAKSPAPPSFPSPESTPAPSAIPFLVSDPDLVPASAPDQISTETCGPTADIGLNATEKSSISGPETFYNGLPSQEEPEQKTKPINSKPPSLKIEVSLNESSQDDEEHELQVPKASYNFDMDQLHDDFNPFTSGGSKIQNSPPPCCPSTLPRLEPIGSSLPVFETGTAAQMEAEVTESTEPRPVKLEFGVDEGEVSKPPPRKLGGRKSLGKLPAKKQKPKGSGTASKPAPEPAVSQSITEPVSEPAAETAVAVVSESSAPLDPDDIPITKSAYNFDPSQWDDPNFNPFGSNSQVSTSPVLAKTSYNFDPDNFDDSVDPFKPLKSLSNEDSFNDIPQPEKTVKDGGKEKARLPREEKRERQSPKKSKDKTATNSCKVKKYENQSLVLDVCNQEEDAVVVQAPEVSHRVRHATDEEKLASTAIMGPTAESQGERGDPECSRRLGKSQPVSDMPLTDEPEMKPAVHLEEKDSCSMKYDMTEELTISQIAKVFGSQDQGQDPASPYQDNIPLSEMDKAAVLTLIREEIIAKDIEANEWKRKYEESRAEVMEMRKIVAEYEKTVAQMIEDEQQQKSLSSQKSVGQLTMERDQALADLNSVERSLSDLFRRYENLKTVLEGFKKNEEVLKKCAQEYLMRVKQEEQRYHTLKLHAEEKLDKANEEIAQVRAKANGEGVALNASLRKEQMKVESLERAVLQKNQEIEELTKICDELIAKLGTD
ncbi:transforming acidic coiled-coil-containing protein 1 isoform X2 [Lampris incognitus]|uniref:transforming acidic coiled-coil-containing protein 1 isoform X2 n=1 Tax=Lampris incognitus TaxID=2546036 RepID=UPI0024B54717|nr:transforming acidic coiled-coil-containing protein 1 isoform X2 [Lampris incognitus]